MLDLAAFAFETIAVLINRLRSLRQAPVISAISIATVLMLLWALAVTWIPVDAPYYGLVLWTVSALGNLGISPGMVFVALLVSTIPIYGLGLGLKFNDDQKGRSKG